jgi:hypothetical protein
MPKRATLDARLLRKRELANSVKSGSRLEIGVELEFKTENSGNQGGDRHQEQAHVHV